MARFSPSRARSLGVIAVLTASAVAASLVAQTGTPAIQVVVGTSAGPIDFGTAPVGVANSRTFTVTNTGTANLLVSEAISVPPGFTLMASFPGVPGAVLPTNVPAFAIAPNASATFVVALNSATPGLFGGNVSFRTNVSGKDPFVIGVSGRVIPPPAILYADDTDAGFTTTAGWHPGYAELGASGRNPYLQTLTWAYPGKGAEAATWTFAGLEPGQYKVSATWVGYKWGASNTPYTICDGTTPVGTVRVNQTVDSAGAADNWGVWQDLGTFTITGTTLSVKMTDDANSYPNADGVRICRVGYPRAIVDDSGAGFSKPLGQWHPGYTETGADYLGSETWAAPSTTPGTATAKARWTFAVVPGIYRVMASYHGYAWGATNAPYSVFDNTTSLTPNPIRVNQKVTPTDLTDLWAGWKDLGTYTIGSTTLNVELSNDADSWPNADAVRIDRVVFPTTPSSSDAVRFLEQATWGPTSALVTQVQSAGHAAWLNQQFAATPTRYPTLPLFSNNDNVANNNTTSCYGDPAVSGNPARSACLRDNYSMYPLQARFFTNALYGGDQLRQRVAWGLHKTWVVSGVDLRQPSWVTPYLQILNDNAFGNYRTIMYKVTLNPAMGNYLDMAGSTRASPNENYPRELLQLFTIGLTELNPDGTPKTNANGPIPTYDQALVNSITKVFTGWNFAQAPASGIPNYIDAMRLGGAATENPNNHDFTTKTLFRGFVQPARTANVANAYLDLNEALDNIYNHPSTAPFVCKQMIQNLVTSNPTPAYVARVVDVFNRNKTSATQLREVVRAILLDPEARGDFKSAANYGHLKEPVLYVNNLMRLYDAKSANRTQNSDGYLNPDVVNMGQDVYRPPSVFSYFSPFKVAVGGSPPVLGPEFQLQTTSTVLRRTNFINQGFTPNSTRAIDVVRNAGTTPAGTHPVSGNPLVPTGPFGTAVDVSPLASLASNPSALADELNRLMLHGSMTADMKKDIVTAVSAVAASNVNKRVRTAVYLVATSSQYQVQK